MYIYRVSQKKNRDYQCFGQNFQNFFLSLKSEQTNIFENVVKKIDKPVFYSPCMNTGLLTKDETSETTVRNIHCLFHYIHDKLQP